MKHRYMIPALKTQQLGCEAMIAESLSVSNTTVSNGGWVKEDRASGGSSYNVWDDDWSN